MSRNVGQQTVAACVFRGHETPAHDSGGCPLLQTLIRRVERLELAAGYTRPVLTADGYHLNVKYAGISYARCALVASRLPWRWEGVVHEYLACGAPFKLETLHGPTVIVAHDGARSRDPDTYRKDAALLEGALRENPNSTRDTFYLAQSYRDAGEIVKARDTYRRRATMNGWEEEGWFAQYQAAIMAPTEILARQHWQTLSNLLAGSEVKMLLLTGGLTPRQRQEALIAIAAAKVDLLIGTHAPVWTARAKSSIARWYTGTGSF